jgi:predicted neutral ceramidase superfamily lipid hydrolase
VSLATRDGLAARAAAQPQIPPVPRKAAGPLTYTRLKWTSFVHSCVYVALLICAFAAGSPQPLTFVLGLAHGLLWIFMSLACLAAARLRIVSLRLAVAVAVLGGVGPFFGSFEFIREQRQRAALE